MSIFYRVVILSLGNKLDYYYYLLHDFIFGNFKENKEEKRTNVARKNGESKHQLQ